MADGLRQAGQWADAFDHYQKLIDLEPHRTPLDQVGKSLTVRRDRWFQGQLTMLRSEAKDDAAARIDAAIQTRLQAATAAGTIDALQRFIDYFGNQPVSATARRELVRRLQGSGRMLDAELTMRDGTASAAADEAVRQPIKQDAVWPVGKVESSLLKTKNPSGNGYGRYVIEMRGDPGPFMSDVSLHFDDGRHLLIATDGWGTPAVAGLAWWPKGNARTSVLIGPGPMPMRRTICCWSCSAGRSWRSTRWALERAAWPDCCGPRT